jgi:hypothetical protein
LLGPLCLATLLAAGCGSGTPLGEVEGTVNWEGRPLANVAVEFIPDADKGTSGPRSTAVTDAEGHFVLRCEDQRPGAVIGFYRVVILPTGRSEANVGRDPRRNRGAKAAGNPDTSGVFPPRLLKYESATSTPLRKEVKPGKQRLDLTLE